METNYDWSRFVKRININATVADLYTSWATRAGIERWFVRLSEFTDSNSNLLQAKTVVQKGTKYKWRWYGYSDDTTEYGEITAANGKDMLEFTFATTMKVQIKIKTEDGANIVELQQYDIPTDEKGKTNFYIGCAEGWTFYLANLKSFLEGGIDLRNKNETLKKMINS